MIDLVMRINSVQKSLTCVNGTCRCSPAPCTLTVHVCTCLGRSIISGWNSPFLVQKSTVALRRTFFGRWKNTFIENMLPYQTCWKLSALAKMNVSSRREAYFHMLVIPKTTSLRGYGVHCEFWHNAFEQGHQRYGGNYCSKKPNHGRHGGPNQNQKLGTTLPLMSSFFCQTLRVCMNKSPKVTIDLDFSKNKYPKASGQKLARTSFA